MPTAVQIKKKIIYHSIFKSKTNFNTCSLKPNFQLEFFYF